MAKPRLKLVVSNPFRMPSTRTAAGLLRIVRPIASEDLSGAPAQAFGGAHGRSQLVVVLSLLAAGLLTLAASLGQVLAGGLAD